MMLINRKRVVHSRFKGNGDVWNNDAGKVKNTDLVEQSFRTRLLHSFGLTDQGRDRE